MRIVTTSSGGDIIRKTMKEAARKHRNPDIDVGFFATARYDDGTYVATVAAINEHGTADRTIPERPFFRLALNDVPDGIYYIVKRYINRKTLRVTIPLANRIGNYVRGAVVKSIVDLDRPANAPSVKAAKLQKATKANRKKSSKGGKFAGIATPLIDSGVMRDSVAYRVQ